VRFSTPEEVRFSSGPGMARMNSLVSCHSGRGVSARERSQFDAFVRGSMQALRKSAMEPTPQDSSLVSLFVKSRYFSLGFGVLIVLSTVLIGVETQVLSSLSAGETASDSLLAALSSTNYLLTFLFTAEIALRLYVHGLHFFVEERLWNCFDLTILLLALFEVALEAALEFSGKKRNLGTAKLLRLVRLTRLLRLVRTFRQLKPLRTLVQSIIFAGRSVFWALLLLVMIAYAFGVILTQAVTEYTEGGTRIQNDDLVAYFGDLYRSMLSLWMAVSGGMDWIALTDSLDTTGSSVWAVLILVYIVFVHFFILNVVTGVFCQNAFEGAQQDLDLSIEAQLREKQTYVDRLRMLFREMREDSTIDTSSGLTAAELHFQLSKPKVQSWFNTLDIDAKQTWKLYKILDQDNSGLVSLEDFVDGCLRLRGQATRVDVESLKWEIRDANLRSEETAERLAELIIDPKGYRPPEQSSRRALGSVDSRAASGSQAQAEPQARGSLRGSCVRGSEVSEAG